jgi:catechol-2,3-dioxygenase
MLAGPEWLALEVKYLDRARSFYEAFLDLDVRAERDGEVAFAAGETDLVLRAPGPVPQGGLHTHYALTVPEAAYDRWYDRLDERFDLVEHRFGDRRSLYFYDTEGNCVELGEAPVEGSGVAGCFEVVLEVEALARAVEFYTALGFEERDRGDGRVRLAGADFAIELWEPRLGIADARGGVHVDLGVRTAELEAAADRVVADALSTQSVPDGVRVRDPDGHYVTLL